MVSQVEDAKEQLRQAAFAFVDGHKERALSSVFLEPTKMFYAAVNEDPLLENVEVHGGSVYVAVLLSTLGVRCPRFPFLLDYPLSAVSFLDALDPEQVKALWCDDNLGKSFKAVPECREPKRLEDAHVQNHWSNFLFPGYQTWQIANNAVDPDSNPEARDKLRVYLEQFAHYFSRDFIVPKLAQYLLSREDSCSALQTVLDDLRLHGRCRLDAETDFDGSVAVDGAGAGVGGGEEDSDDDDNGGDVRHWLWDLECLPAKFHLDRASLLLDAAGLLKEGCS